MEKINVMINGLGNMGQLVANEIVKDERFKLFPYSFTEEKLHNTSLKIGDNEIVLINMGTFDHTATNHSRINSIRDLDELFFTSKGLNMPLVAVDFSKSMDGKLNKSVAYNAGYFARLGIPSVIGATGGDVDMVKKVYANSSASCILNPNMAKGIIGMQKFFEFLAEHNPYLFDGAAMEIEESHQLAKGQEPSGTAKKCIEYFNKLGMGAHLGRKPIIAEDIIMERNPEAQRKAWGVPESYLGGHGHHYYRWKQEYTSFSKLKRDIGLIALNTHNLAQKTQYLFEGYQVYEIAPDLRFTFNEELNDSNRELRRYLTTCVGLGMVRTDNCLLGEARRTQTPSHNSDNIIFAYRWFDAGETALFGLSAKWIGNNNIQYEFYHNVNGRQVYVPGTLDAIVFAAEMQKKGVKGKVKDMWDVLTNNMD